MAGKRCRNIHFTARRRPRKATTARRGVRTRAPETAAPTPPVVTFTRDDLAAKLVSLNVPSAREAQKAPIGPSPTCSPRFATPSPKPT